MAELAVVEIELDGASKPWRLPIRFCLDCGGLLFDWLGNAYRCQACGELQVPASILCPWCLGTFSSAEITAHRERCGPVRYSEETRRRMAEQEREWLAAARPGDSDWELTHVQPRFKEAG